MAMISVANKISPSRSASAGMALPGVGASRLLTADAALPSVATEASSTRTTRRIMIKAAIRNGLRIVSSIGSGLPPLRVGEHLLQLHGTRSRGCCRLSVQRKGPSLGTNGEAELIGVFGLE